MILILKNLMAHFKKNGLARILIVLVIIYFISWAGMSFTEGIKSEIVKPINFLWYFIVTITTVGYGDLYPTTALGKIIGIIIIVIGIGIAAFLLTEIASFAIEFSNRRRTGKLKTSLSGHIVILVGHAKKVKINLIVDQILADKKRKDRGIVICSDAMEENPVDIETKTKIEFVHAEITSDEAMKKSNIGFADSIYICGKDDGETTLASLAVNRINKKAQIVVILYDQKNEKHIENIERKGHIKCIISFSERIAVQEMQDQGVARLAEIFFANDKGATYFRIDIPESFSGWTFQELLDLLYTEYKILLCGVGDGKTRSIKTFFEDPDFKVTGGMLIYYTASERKSIDWEKISKNKKN